MVSKIKFRLKAYRRYEKDIWGFGITNLVPHNRFLRYVQKIFVFQQAKRLRLRQEFTYDSVYVFRRKGKRIKKRFASLRLVKLYYVILKYRHFRNLARIAGRKDGHFQTNFCYMLEGRLSCLIFKANLTSDMFLAIHFVRGFNIVVNRKLYHSPNNVIKVGDIITLLRKQYRVLRANLLLRFNRAGVYFSPPRYLAISYKIFTFSVLAFPKNRDLAFPMKFDIYRATGYY